MASYVLYNSLANNGNGEAEARKAEPLIKGAIKYCDVTKLESWADFFASLAPEDRIILCGGDGTINRFVNDTEGILPANELFYFPAGTGNDFMKDIGGEPRLLPLRTYIENLPKVEVNGKVCRFLNNVGFGIDGYCCKVGDKLKETSDKPVNYTSIAIKGLLFHFSPVNAEITVDGKKYSYKKVWLAPTMNGRYYGGGMNAAPGQDRLNPDGTLSLMLFHGKGRLRTLTVFPSIFKGEHVKYTDMVALLTGRDITVTFDKPTALQIDGETVLGVTTYHAWSCK